MTTNPTLACQTLPLLKSYVKDTGMIFDYDNFIIVHKCLTLHKCYRSIFGSREAPPTTLDDFIPLMETYQSRGMGTDYEMICHYLAHLGEESDMIWVTFDSPGEFPRKFQILKSIINQTIQAAIRRRKGDLPIDNGYVFIVPSVKYAIKFLMSLADDMEPANPFADEDEAAYYISVCRFFYPDFNEHEITDANLALRPLWVADSFTRPCDYRRCVEIVNSFNGYSATYLTDPTKFKLLTNFVNSCVVFRPEDINQDYTFGKMVDLKKNIITSSAGEETIREIIYGRYQDDITLIRTDNTIYGFKVKFCQTGRDNNYTWHHSTISFQTPIKRNEVLHYTGTSDYFYTYSLGIGNSVIKCYYTDNNIASGTVNCTFLIKSAIRKVIINGLNIYVIHDTYLEIFKLNDQQSGGQYVHHDFSHTSDIEIYLSDRGAETYYISNIHGVVRTYSRIYSRNNCYTLKYQKTYETRILSLKMKKQSHFLFCYSSTPKSNDINKIFVINMENKTVLPEMHDYSGYFPRMQTVIDFSTETQLCCPNRNCRGKCKKCIIPSPKFYLQMISDGIIRSNVDFMKLSLTYS